MDTLFVSDVVYHNITYIRAQIIESKNIAEPDRIGLTLLRCYNAVMANPCIVGHNFALTFIEQCLASKDRSEEEQASLAKKIGESVVACIEHIRLQPLKKTLIRFAPHWNDAYPNSVQIGRVLSATGKCSNGLNPKIGLGSNESFIETCHSVPDLEQMLGEAVIKAVLEFRFGVSSFGDLFGMAVDAALDSKDIDEDLAHVIRENGGPCDPDLFEVVLVKTKGVLRLCLSPEADNSLDCFQPTIAKLFLTGNMMQHDAVTFRKYLNDHPHLEVIVFKDVGAYQSAFEVIATVELPKLKLVMIDNYSKYINEDEYVYDPNKMVSDLRKCLGYRPRNNLILMVRHYVHHTEESWSMVKFNTIGSMIPGFEYTPCEGVFHMIE